MELIIRSGSINFTESGVSSHKSRRFCLSTDDDFFTIDVFFIADLDRELCCWEKIRERNRDDPASGVLSAVCSQAG